MCERSDFFERSIEQLRVFQEERRRISDDINRSIDHSLFYLSSDLSMLDFLPRNASSVTENRRAHLEKLVAFLEQEKRKEKTIKWRDDFLVSRDLNSLLKEYVEHELRKRLIKD